MVINRERIKLLLEHLKKLPDDEFDYTNWFKLEIQNGDNIPEYVGPQILQGSRANNVIRKAAKTNGPPACKTAGCIAGHCCLLFWEECKDRFEYEGFETTATRLLGFDYHVGTPLFQNYMMVANKHDAIMRLEHLMEFDDLEDYDWTLERHHAEGDT